MPSLAVRNRLSAPRPAMHPPMGQRGPWRRNAPATSAAGRLMAGIVGRRSFVVNQTFPQHGPSFTVPDDEVLGAEVQGTVPGGDRRGDHVAGLEVRGVAFLAGEEHPPLERRR